MMTFKEKLVVLRKIKHLTQDEFASAVGVSRQAVYKWESGQSYPEALKLVEIKLLFGVSIDDLLDDTYEIELPKKKRRRRKANTEGEAAQTPAAPAVKEEPKAAPTVKAEPKAAPIVKEEPKAAPVVKEEPVVKAEPIVEAPKAEPVVEAPKAEPKAEPAAEAPKAEVKTAEAEKPAASKLDSVNLGDKYGKRGGLFGRIFGNKK